MPFYWAYVNELPEQSVLGYCANYVLSIDFKYVFLCQAY